MAQLLNGGSQVKIETGPQAGQTVTAQQGAWYDGRQYWGGTLSDPGVINSLSNQQGAGQAVSSEVNRQSDQAQGLAPGTIDKFVQQQTQQLRQTTPTAGGYNANTSGGSVDSVGGTGSLPSLSTPTIDLQGQYKSLYESSGIAELEAQLAEKEKAFTEAKGINNDNPFLSEAGRVGREAKLQTLYDDRTRNLRDEIATKKADVETQLNLALKQFDINSQQAQNALSQFNTLLSIGALDSASGEAIANYTRSTGISSDLIYSAINARKKANTPTQLITSTNDNGVVTATVINPETGAIIKQTSLGAIGNAQNSSGSTKINEAEVKNELVSDIRGSNGKNPLGVRDVYAIYSDLLDPNDILRIYNANSPYGPAKESQQELQLLGVDTEKFYGASSKF